MSLVEDNIKTKSETVNVEDILANFFLKKIDMKSSKSKSNSKYKKKSKHKHKSKKHKHKSERRSKSSERRNSNSLVNLKSIGCNSSSEEKDIKRLKKLKKLDVKDPKKFNSFLPAPHSTQSVLPSNEDFPNSALAKIDIPYGPSLELLLTGSDVVKRNAESKKQNILLFDQNDESSSHPLSSISACYDGDPKLSTESVSTSKEPEATKLIENTCEGMKCNKENILNDVEMSSNKLLNTSKQIVGVPELQNSDIDIVAKLELSDKKGEKYKDKSKSRSRSKSNPRRHSKFKSCSPQSESRKHSMSRSRSNLNARKRSRSKSCSSHSRSRKRSRSRSNYRSGKKRSYSRDHSKSRYLLKSNTRRSRSRNRSRKRKRSRTRSLRRHRRSRSWSDSKDYVKSKHNVKRRSRSIGRRDKSRSSSREHISHRSRRESSHNDRSNRNRNSSERESKLKKMSRSNSKEKYRSSKSCKIDQAKIREIAEKNVLNMIQQGTLPEGISMEHFKKKELVSIKAGGKSVQELTDFCAKLSKKENEVNNDTNDASNFEGENDFIHHPFKLKEQPIIKLNIKNAVQIPIKTHAEKFAETAKLSSQFPVSSGSQHKQKELEWIPLVPEESKKDLKPNEIKSVIPNESTISVGEHIVSKTMECSTSSTLAPLSVSSDIPSIPLPSDPGQPLPPPLLPPLPPSLPPMPTPPVPPFQLLSSNCVIRASEVNVPYTNSTATQSVSCPTCPLPNSLPVPTCHSGQVLCTESGRSFFGNQKASTSTSFDFSSVFCKKFQAEQKLQEDPNNHEALKAIQEAEAALQEWVNSCRVPGMFYGSTYVKPLPRERLGGLKDYRVKRTLYFAIFILLLVFLG